MRVLAAAKTYGELLALVQDLEALASDAERGQATEAVDAAWLAGLLAPDERLELGQSARSATTDAELHGLLSTLDSLLHGTVTDGRRRQPARARAADQDREHVARRLQAAVTEGRLTLEEFDDRVRKAYAARYVAELEALVADLPPAKRAPLDGTVAPP